MTDDNPRPDAASRKSVDRYTDGSYLAINPSWGVEDSRWKAGQVDRILRSNGITPQTFCEIGCGAGEILRQMAIAYPAASLVGYEVSPQAYALCRERASEHVQFFLKDALDEDLHVDCLLCLDVLEHVEDYFGFLRKIQPKANYKIFHIPLDVSVTSILRGGMMKARAELGHLHYFSKETAIATLVDCGYEILDHFYTTAFADLPAKSFRQHIAKWPRKLAYSVSPDWCTRLLSGSSLMVLAR